jgi:hypothetical protein
MSVFARIMTRLAAAAPDNKTISTDATYLKRNVQYSLKSGAKKGRGRPIGKALVMRLVVAKRGKPRGAMAKGRAGICTVRPF